MQHNAPHRLLALVLVATLAISQLPASVAFGIGDVTEVDDPLPDFDARTGNVLPTSAQLGIVSRLGGSATWSRFGTPQSLIKYGGYLATGLSGDAVSAASAWISANKSLFRLSDTGVANLELLSDSKMSGYDGHAVIFRQRFGGLPAAQDGMITVGVTGGKVAYVSSSAAGDGNAPGTPSLSAQDAWLRAAANIGRNPSLGDISNVRTEYTWTVFDVAGFAQPQRARLVALPTPTKGIRPAYEANVLNVAAGAATAFTSFIDAQSGEVLFRQNRAQRFAAAAPQTFSFSGSYTATTCGPFEGPYNAPSGTKTIDVVASAATTLTDIVLELHYAQNNVVASSDVLFSPEAIHYAPDPFPLSPPSYYVRVCPFASDPGPGPYTYAGSITIGDIGFSAFPYPPEWKAFEANPPLNLSSTDSRKLWCWDAVISGTPVPNCERALRNLAARAPWDHDIRTNSSTFTTRGNAANSAEAWVSPLTPGEGQAGFRPTATDRKYIYPWTNVWQTSNCFTPFVPGQSHDISAAAVNLFAMHNRMHDWAYFLGFTEQNFNLQDNNFGNTPPNRENDPELGGAQAGALTGGTPTFLGRDNANQITLQDGIPGITNMYLWQPIAASFYSPCVDGDYDMSVIGHEYTHAISNRMVGGPDANLTGYQAGSMGESWSDLDAVEYLNEYGFVPTNGENPFSVGAYVTGNKQKGIRNYSLDDSPLNYSDLGYDIPGPEVHSDGEVWNAVNFDIRQALAAKYDATFPSSDTALQRACADGTRPADLCPGNRRWIQLVYDAWLLMPPAVSMLGARDAYLAADVMRFSGANQLELWRAFARRGMGDGATSNTNADSDPTPSFKSPVETNATITFRAQALDEGNAAVNAKIFVGRYEARAVAIAQTSLTGGLSSAAQFVPGTYDFTAQAPGYGLFHFTQTFSTGQTATVTISLPTNRASQTKGATASATSTLSTDASDAATNAIDDSEATQWSGTGQLTAPQAITIDLAGTSPVTIARVNVSAMLRSGQNRFTALRQFRLEVSTNGSTFTPVLTSAADAFPGVRPRPAAPDLIVRSFVLSSPVQATHLRLVALTNQCRGGPDFQGDQDSDPLNNSDCVTGNSAQATRIRVAEIQAFSSAGAAGPPNQPAALTLAPKTATNIVGTQHCVTATVTNGSGQPLSAVSVRFSVTGSNSAAGTGTTNPSGQANFCYTGANAGSDAISAFADANANGVQDSGEPGDTAAKSWITAAPATLVLAPKSATDPVGDIHCVTATVKDMPGNLLAGVTVRFSVTDTFGRQAASGSQSTDANGNAKFCYSSDIVGTDTIKAYADTNNNSTQDGGEPSDTAAKTWVLPVTTPNCEIKITTGGFFHANNGDRSSFGGNAKSDGLGLVSGNEEYQDHGPMQPMNAKSLNVLAITCTPDRMRASIFGQATIDGAGSFSYRIDVRDAGQPGTVDTYRIRVGSYDSGVHFLEGGDIQIH